MPKYLALLRGINVGGNNKIPMAQLKLCLEGAGFKDVVTYIQSGNVMFKSQLPAATAGKRIEAALPLTFSLVGNAIKVLVISKQQLETVVGQAPKGFGTEPAKYHSDVIFLIDVPVSQAMGGIETHLEVDAVWPGKGVIYFQRLSAQRTKSRLGKVISKPVYKSMTIRSWNTTTKLLDLMNA